MRNAVGLFHLMGMLLLAAPAAARAQDPQLSPAAPRDKPASLGNAAQLAKFQQAIAPYVAEARASYPEAKRKYLAGLPAKYSFFVTGQVTDTFKHMEQVFVAVDSIAHARIYGRIYSQIVTVQGYRLRQPFDFPESELIDWLITHPDGTEEGNVVGKFLDTYRPN